MSEWGHNCRLWRSGIWLANPSVTGQPTLPLATYYKGQLLKKNPSNSNSFFKPKGHWWAVLVLILKILGVCTFFLKKQAFGVILNHLFRGLKQKWNVLGPPTPPKGYWSSVSECLWLLKTALLQYNTKKNLKEYTFEAKVLSCHLM